QPRPLRSTMRSGGTGRVGSVCRYGAAPLNRCGTERDRRGSPRSSAHPPPDLLEAGHTRPSSRSAIFGFSYLLCRKQIAVPRTAEVGLWASTCVGCEGAMVHDSISLGMGAANGFSGADLTSP